MASASTRTELITFTGDAQGTEVLQAAANALSPGGMQVYTLVTGANTITVPTGGSTPTCASILPPAGNLIAITLKGITGDSGIALHLTDFSALALDPSQVSFVLTAASGIAGLRIYWS